MRQGLQGIEKIGEQDRMTKKLDALKMQKDRDFLDSNQSGNPNWESTGSMYPSGNFGD